MLRWLLLVMAAVVPLTAAQETFTGVRGVVRDPSGTAAPRVAVALTDAAGLTIRVVSGDDGSFAFPKIQPGTHSLIAWWPGLASERYDKVVVVAGRTTLQNVQLNPDSAMSLNTPPTPPMEIPLCTSFPNGPALIHDASGWRIRMHPGDAPLPTADAATPKKDQ